MYVIIGYVAHDLIAVLLSFFLASEGVNSHVGNPKYQGPMSSL